MYNETCIFHAACPPWQYSGPDRALRLVVRASRELINRIECLSCDPCDTFRDHDGMNQPQLASQLVPLTYSDSHFDYFVMQMKMETHKLRYHFLVSTQDGLFLLDERGVSEPCEELYVRPFFVSFLFDADHTSVPQWAADTIWYQIFPDRFWTSDIQKGLTWDSSRVFDKERVYGGDFRGISEKIPYLQKLGVSGVYLNPIFSASSIHRYDTVDYYALDPRLGSKEDFVYLCEQLHACGIRVMLDGVFNHCSWNAAQFLDVLKNGAASEYYDWFLVTDAERLSGLRTAEGETPSKGVRRAPYNTFAFEPSMPKWNTANPAVAEYLIGAAEYWTKLCGIDAWRLDVPDEIHPSFLRQFREQMKRIRPDLYIVGEIWSDASRWLFDGLFDGVMNYPVYFTVRDFFVLRQIDAQGFCDHITQYLALTPETLQRGMYHFCSTHDVPRILWFSKGEQQPVWQSYLMTAMLPGGLSVYYGDEAGLSGGYDPDNRRCMVWQPEPDISDFQAVLGYARAFKGRTIRLIEPMGQDIVALHFTGEEQVLYLSRNEFGYHIGEDI